MANGHDLKVTIAVLVKDEESTIGVVLDELLLYHHHDDIVVIIDGIKNATIEKARQRKVRIIHGREKGKGNAVRLGIDNIASDVLVFMDADGSHASKDIAKLIRPIIEDKADLVIASRIKGGSEEFSGSIKNRLHYYGNILSSYIINLIWGQGNNVIADCQNGFRAIRSSAAKELGLKEDSFAIEQEMVIKAIKLRYRVQEVASYEFKRKHGKSHISMLRMLPKYIRCFIANLR